MTAILDQETFSIQIFNKANLKILTFQYCSNSIQPGFINEAAYQGGVAAAAGEIEKDEKQQDCEEANGCLFYPLVAESLGTWLPSIL